jgi:MFS transporter, DHA1 family, staphyloferrin A biosynthesis exporter
MRLVASLRYRDWRYLWSGLMAAQTGEWMDNIAINWLVWIQTGSPLALGTVNLVRGLPTMLFSLVGGVVADRVDRRALMMSTRLIGLTATATMAALATFDVLQLWQLYALLVVRGITFAFDSPARSSLIGDLVPRSDLTNAVALHSAVFNGSRMVGPAIAGVIIGLIGAPFVLWLNALAYTIVLGTLFKMRVPARAAQHAEMSAWGTFVDGVSYVRSQPVVLVLLLVGVIPFLLGQPYQSMLPIFATNVFAAGPQGLGMLNSGAAAGSLVGAFVISGIGEFPRKGRVMMLGLIGFGGFIALFSLTPWLFVAAVLLFVAGASQQLYATTNSTLVQMVVPSEYRGRVMGVHQLDRGFIPIGSFLVGLIAELAGAPFAIALMAGCLATVGLALLFVLPRIRGLD